MMMKPLLLLLCVWCSYLLGISLAQVPTDWAPRVAAGQLLFSVDEPQLSLNTYVGNGYLATVIGSQTIYISGLFNGLNTRDPSHRARIPSSVAVYIANTDVVKIGSALDIEQGVFYRRSTVGSTFIEQRWFASQIDKNMLIHEIYFSNPSSNDQIIDLYLYSGDASPDINFNTTVESWYVSMEGSIITPEEPNGETVSVGVVYTPIPKSIIIPANTNSITFSYITIAITSLESVNPLSDAMAQFKLATSNSTGFLDQQISAWNDIWASGLEVGGDLKLAQAINSSLYYILSSIRPDWHYSLSPGGLASNGYNGHTFWDCETWMYPSLLLFYPELAQSVLQYRFDRIPGAFLKAKSEGYSGAMFPWESAFTGQEVCPVSAPTGQLEQHISGDIAFAVRQYYITTQNQTWLEAVGYPIVAGAADFFVSRARLNSTTNLYVIDGVIPPDEYAVNVNNSVYTNYVAKITLSFAAEAAQILNKSPNLLWSLYAQNMYIPFDNVTQTHPEFDGYNGQTIKQADVVLLPYPLLISIPTKVQYNDLVYYEARTDPNGPAMTYGMHAVSWLSLGYKENATALFTRSYANSQPPFGVWTETPTGGTTNFITGAGGFLQAVWAGYGGIRITEQGLFFNPQLPNGVDYFKLRGFQYLSSWIDLVLTTNVTITVTNQLSGAPNLKVQDSNGKSYPLQVGKSLVLAQGPYTMLQA